MADLDFKRPNNEREKKETICDVHRDAYQLISSNEQLLEEDKLFLLERLETAFKMGKSMDAKLRQYKHNYDQDWWEKAKKAWDWSELKGEE